jgi:hypothetical protein
MAARRDDKVETAVRAMIAGLGALSAHQQVHATTAYTLAQRLDGEQDSAKAATLSRELRLVVAALTSGAAAASGGKPAEQSDDPVARIQDELARKRAEREASG